MPMGAESVLHLPDLVFHEAGHVILGFFGRFIRVLGGSLFQFGLPVALALQLVLLGGKTGAEVEGHDWEYLLTELGWLQYDRTLGLWAHRVGLMMMAGGIVWGAMLLAKRFDASAEGSDGL